MTRPVRDDDREAFELMSSTTLYSQLPERLRRYRSDTFNDKYKRLGWDELSRTITAHIAKDGYWYIHPSEPRTLTVREAARIQTFPDDFRFAGSRSDAFRQIGNAVPPLLGRAVAESITPRLEPQIGLPFVRTLRDAIVIWGHNHRNQYWWLHPGPDMTAAAAAVACLLEVHRLPLESARELMEPLKALELVSLDSLRHIDAAGLSESRKSAIRELRRSMREGNAIDWTPMVATRLGSMQRKTFSILRGGNDLIVNNRIGSIVALLMSLPDEHTGLHTDIKVALSQIVTRDEEAALRMSAIRVMTTADARAIVESIAQSRTETIHEEKAS